MVNADVNTRLLMVNKQHFKTYHSFTERDKF